MKTQIPIFVLFLIFFYNPLQAQDSPFEPYPNIIKINPISFAFGNLNVIYERALNPSSSIQVSANYWYRIFGTEVRGIGARVGYRFYITNRVKPAPSGFYIGPQLSFNSFTEKSTDESANATGLGLLLGYQWVFRSGVTLDLGAGPIYQFAQNTSTEESFEGFLPNIYIAVGYNF